MIKLIFGFPVHENFKTVLYFYYIIKKFNNNPSFKEVIGKIDKAIKEVKKEY